MTGIKKKKVVLSLFGGLLVAGIVIAALCYIFFFNRQRTFQITETYRITSSSGAETYLTVCLPASTGYQTVSAYVFDGFNDYSMENYDGWNELTAKIPNDGSETLVTISYSVKLTRNARSWDGMVSDEYTQPQQYVDSGNEEIINLGRRLRAGNEYETAQNIQEYVRGTLNFPSGQQVNKEQASASELLKDPVGVCGDYAILMTALLRAEGIPARKIDGLVFKLPLKKAADWSHPGGSHAWVEFFADGKWHFADPTWGQFDQNDTAHLSYGTYESNIGSGFQKNRMETVKNTGFYLCAAMSAPLKFMVYSTDENTLTIPRADVTPSLLR